jgi:hypothetical protein
LAERRSACGYCLLLCVVAGAFGFGYLALDLGILSLPLSSFAAELSIQAVDSGPRPRERFACSREGVMTSPQDFASRSPLVEEPVAFIGQPLALVGDPLALIRDPFAIVRESLALVGGTISFVGATPLLVELTPQLLEARNVRRYCLRISPIFSHSSACRRAR